MKNNKIYIYTLNDPDTNIPRYVGQTYNLKYRLRQHIHEAIMYNKKRHKDFWIRRLNSLNKKPIIEVLEISNPIDCNNDEKYWIEQLIQWGFKLTNHIDRGFIIRGRKVDPEIYLKVSQKLKGRKRPLEVRKKISESHKGKKLSEETKQKLREINLNREFTEKHRLGIIKNAENRKIKIGLLNENNEIILKFNSIGEASQFANCSNGFMSQHLKGIYKYCKKKRFIKLEDIV